MKKTIAIVTTLAMSAALCTVPVYAKENENEEISIGFALKTLEEERWQNEVKYLEQEAEANGVNIDIQCANGDADKQISQIENMVTNGVDVIMVCCVDDGALANVLNDAHEQGVLIVSYDDNLSNTWIDAYVGYDPYEVGLAISEAVLQEAKPGNYAFLYGDKGSGLTVNQFAQGMKDTLQPLFDEGKAEMVMEQYCTGWKPENAMAHVENLISNYGTDIAAVVCMNDGTASGAIQALEAAGIAGDVLVTGMDGDLTACQRIVQGTQISTVFKNPARLAKAAVETSIKIVKGEELDTDATANFGKNDCPWVKVGFDIVTKDTVDDVMIDTGVFTHEEVYGE
ncbi:substrate-binding domain-containing protein [Blautia schinkii]|nr:substrate-binding domain-containing protein [Blautia schinkii]